jgi:hypothetical protein
VDIAQQDQHRFIPSEGRSEKGPVGEKKGDSWLRYFGESTAGQE